MRASPSKKKPARGPSLTVLLAGTLALAACKNRSKTLAPVAIDSGPDKVDVGGDMRSAPVWPQVERLVLTNGLLVHWLPEEDAAGLHLRLLLPTDQDKTPLPAATLNVIASAIQDGITRRTRGLNARVALSAAPGRMEIVVQVDEAHASRALWAIGKTLATEPNDKTLSALLRREGSMHTKIGSAESSSNALLATLLDLPRAHLHSSRAEVEALTPARVRRSWKTFLEPRRSVLLVHANSTPAESDEALSRLAKIWRSPSPHLSAAGESATERLRVDIMRRTKRGTKNDPKRILSSPSAPLVPVSELENSQHHAVMAIGRVIPTPSAKDRALARIAQRLIAQDADLRLLIAGPISVLILRARVSARDPRASVAKTVQKLEGYATKRFTTARMQQAARLWLGARVVSASLQGEDWTALYSEALDLANDDKDARNSLARDARFMLETTPDELLAFTKKWFAPKSGEAGWGWSIAGAADDTLSELSPLLPKD